MTEQQTAPAPGTNGAAAAPDQVDAAIAATQVHPLPGWCVRRMAQLRDQMGKLEVAFNECFTAGVLAQGVEVDALAANLAPDGAGYTLAPRPQQQGP